MYLITVKEDNRLFEFGETLDYMDNGYPRLVEKNVAFPTNDFNVYEVEEMPDYVELEKYCYTEKDGFYKNENYVYNYSIEERISALEDMMNEIILGGM